MPSTILILEDEPDLLRAMVVRLTAAGFLCTTARNGKEGLVKLEESQPDVVITDLLMPEMDGYDMVHYLRSHEQTATIPVIVLTAVPKSALDQRTAELGASCIMHKPFDSEQLLAAVNNVLRIRQSGGSTHG